MEDYLVELKVKNNKLYSKMLEVGCKTPPELHRLSGIGLAHIYEYLNMKKSPVGRGSRNWNKSALQLAEFFGCLPDELFNEQQMYSPLEINTASVELGGEAIRALTGDKSLLEQYAEDEMISEVHKVLNKVSPRHRKVFEGVYLEGKFLDEAAEDIGVTLERVRQMNIKTMKDIRVALGDVRELYGEV